MNCLAIFPTLEIRAVKTCEVLDRLGLSAVAAAEKRHSRTWDKRLSDLQRVSVVEVSRPWIPAHLKWNPLRDSAIRKLLQKKPEWVFAREVAIGAAAAKQIKRFGSTSRPKLILDVADDLVAVLDRTRSLPRKAYRAIAQPRGMERFALEQADHVLFVVDSAIAHYEERHQLPLRHKASVVPNTPMAPLSGVIPPALNARAGQFLYVGTIDKDIRDFEVILAADRFLAHDVSIDCYTFSPESNQYVRQLSERAMRTRHVRLNFFDAVPNEEYSTLLDRYKVGLIPHHRNEITDFTVPNKLYDYLDRGMLALASDNPAIVSEVKRLGKGSLYLGENPQSFAEGVHESLLVAGDTSAVTSSMPPSFYFEAELRNALHTAGIRAGL